MVLVEDSSDVLDNVESQECIENSAIIMRAAQNASQKSQRSDIDACESRSPRSSQQGYEALFYDERF